MDFSERFNKISGKVSKTCGSVWAFVLAVSLVAGWAIFGPLYKWSEGHSLFINTVTTIITFLMVFIIQNSQNRDSKAIQLKLDELLRAQKDSRNDFINIECLDEKTLTRLKEEMLKVKTGEIIIKRKPQNDTTKNSSNQTSRNSLQGVGL